MCSFVVFYMDSLHSNQVSVEAACNTRWPLRMGSDVSRDVNANTLHMHKVHFSTKRREHRHEEFWNIGRQRFGYSGGIICGFPVTHDSAAWRSYRTSDVPSRCPTVCFLKTWTDIFPGGYSVKHITQQHFKLRHGYRNTASARLVFFGYFRSLFAISQLRHTRE